jgi:hypothetical protein
VEENFALTANITMIIKLNAKISNYNIFKFFNCSTTILNGNFVLNATSGLKKMEDAIIWDVDVVMKCAIYVVRIGMNIKNVYETF